MAVRLMSEARYDPNAFRTLLEKINETQTGDAARAPAFVFNHPQAQTVSLEIAEEIEQLRAPGRDARTSAEFRSFRSTLQKLAYPVATKTAAGPATDTPS